MEETVPKFKAQSLLVCKLCYTLIFYICTYTPLQFLHRIFDINQKLNILLVKTTTFLYICNQIEK